MTTQSTSPARVRVYVGTYTEGNENGIRFGSLDLDTGRLDLSASIICLQNPSFVAIAGDRLYAAHEINRPLA